MSRLAPPVFCSKCHWEIRDGFCALLCPGGDGVQARPASAKKRIYLAGPIAGQSNSACMGWRNFLMQQTNDVDWLNPMDRDYRGARDVPPALVVEPDKRDIDSCDVMIALVEPPSVGTSMEILYAWERGCPVVVIAHGDISPWIRYHSTHVVSVLLDALYVAKGLNRKR